VGVKVRPIKMTDEVEAALVEVAARYGYMARRGPKAGQPSWHAMILALAREPVAIVRLPGDDWAIAVSYLRRYAAALDEGDELDQRAAPLIQRIAEDLEKAR
jgi:hypothetical protein